MNFLAPAFLAGLAAIAIPVIIHLIHRERKRRRRVSVADVPAAHSVSVGAPAEDSASAAARCCAAWRSRCSSPRSRGRSSSAVRRRSRRAARARSSSCSTVRRAWATAIAGRSAQDAARKRSCGALGDGPRDARAVRRRRVRRERADGDAGSRRRGDRRREAQRRRQRSTRRRSSSRRRSSRRRRCRARSRGHLRLPERSAGRTTTRSSFPRGTTITPIDLGGAAAADVAVAQVDDRPRQHRRPRPRDASRRGSSTRAQPHDRSSATLAVGGRDGADEARQRAGARRAAGGVHVDRRAERRRRRASCASRPIR